MRTSSTTLLAALIIASGAAVAEEIGCATTTWKRVGL
jgi:hypothetical protein